MSFATVVLFRLVMSFISRSASSRFVAGSSVSAVDFDEEALTTLVFDSAVDSGLGALTTLVFGFEGALASVMRNLLTSTFGLTVVVAFFSALGLVFWVDFVTPLALALSGSTWALDVDATFAFPSCIALQTLALVWLGWTALTVDSSLAFEFELETGFSGAMFVFDWGFTGVKPLSARPTWLLVELLPELLLALLPTLDMITLLIFVVDVDGSVLFSGSRLSCC